MEHSEWMLSLHPRWLQRFLPLFDPNIDADWRVVSLLSQCAEHGVIRALQASNFSDSYRPFPVGVAMLGHECSDPYIRGHCPGEAFRWFQGSNRKLSKVSRKICGENVALGALIQASYTVASLVVVVGHVQRDDESGLLSPTLHPCGACREELSAVKPITDRTVFITVTRSGAKRLKADEDMTVDTLIDVGEAEVHLLQEIVAKHQTHFQT